MVAIMTRLRNRIEREVYDLKLKLYGRIVNRASFRNFLTNEQTQMFFHHGFDRARALEHLNNHCQKTLGHEYQEETDPCAEHLILFSAISLASAPVHNILEIGTFNGKTAKLLASLFPNASVTTIDLNATDDDFVEFYNRNATAEAFVEARDAGLGQHSNIKFVATNSARLVDWDTGQFDMIWVDGAHGYPIVAFDLINACRLGKDRCIVMVDDVHKSTDANDRMYRSTASFEVMEALTKAKVITAFSLFRKRMSPKYNIRNLTEKYVGLFVLKKND